eukprot:8565269-Karenia_brevis.AAC.1
MAACRKHMTMKWHSPEDISAHMQPHCAPLLMTSAVLAEAMSSGCCKHNETPVPPCFRGSEELNAK